MARAMKVMEARYEFNLGQLSEHPEADNLAYIESIMQAGRAAMDRQMVMPIPNFSKHSIDESFEPLDLKQAHAFDPYYWKLRTEDISITPFAKQYDYGETTIVDNESVAIQGNSWVKIPIDFDVVKSTELTATLLIEGEGAPEIIGLGFETDNKVTSERVIRFFGTQNWGINALKYFSQPSSQITFPLGDFVKGEINYLVFVLDYDGVSKKNNDIKVTFSNVTLRSGSD